MALESLRAFLLEIPLLAQAIEAELGMTPPASSNSDDVRKAHEAAVQRTIAFLKDERLPYAVVTYPEHVSACAICGVEIAGAYWEVNHPDGKGASIPHKALHLFVEHGVLLFREPITNLAGTVIAEQPLAFDLSALKHVLAGIPLPPDVEADLASAPA